MDTEVLICFNNDTELTAEQNGACFITDTKPDFPDDLSVVTVSDPLSEYELHDVEVIECASVDGRYWFALRELPADELYRRQLETTIDTLLIMSAEQEYQLCLMELGIN